MLYCHQLFVLLAILGFPTLLRAHSFVERTRLHVDVITPVIQ